MRCFNPFPGGHSGVVPPDPIPNSEVKRACADGSVALPCKSRSPPGALSLKPPPVTVGVFSCLRFRAARLQARAGDPIPAFAGMTGNDRLSVDRIVSAESVITYDGGCAAIQSALEGSGSCLFT